LPCGSAIWILRAATDRDGGIGAPTSLIASARETLPFALAVIWPAAASARFVASVLIQSVATCARIVASGAGAAGTTCPGETIA